MLTLHPELVLDLLIDHRTDRTFGVWRWRGRVVLVAPAGEA